MDTSSREINLDMKVFTTLLTEEFPLKERICSPFFLISLTNDDDLVFYIPFNII